MASSPSNKTSGSVEAQLTQVLSELQKLSAKAEQQSHEPPAATKVESRLHLGVILVLGGCLAFFLAREVNRLDQKLALLETLEAQTTVIGTELTAQGDEISNLVVQFATLNTSLATRDAEDRAWKATADVSFAQLDGEVDRLWSSEKLGIRDRLPQSLGTRE